MVHDLRWRTGAALLVAWVTGCGAEEAGGTTALDAGGTSPALDAAPICTPQSCACGSLSGVRRCDPAGQLGLCECPQAPAMQDAGVRTIGSCPSGRYAGNFEGEAGFFIALGAVAGFDFFDDQPPLQITLSPPTGSELVAIGSGTMRGNANGAFPFEATIMGMLDCDAEKFTATLVGSVQLVLDGVVNNFTGTMEADYDADTQTLAGGTWTVTGSDADGGFDLGLTGMGTWSATLAQPVNDAGP
jgi:hypothetical protein